MTDQERHTMEHIQTNEDGSDVFHCPTCDRLIVISWPPKYSKTVITVGDDYAIHSGGKGGLSISNIEVLEDDPYLDVYKKYINI